MSTTFTENQQKTIERVESDLLSGRYFTLIAQAARSRYGYQPPVGARYWGAAMVAISQYATWGDRPADEASQILGKVNLYGTEAQAVQQVAEIVADIVRKGWFDTFVATGPEPGRRSDHQHDTKLRDALRLALLVNEVQAALNFNQPVARLGWVLQHLIERESVIVYACYLPRVAKGQAEQPAKA